MFTNFGGNGPERNIHREIRIGFIIDIFSIL
jgi:hypothetical protein